MKIKGLAIILWLVISTAFASDEQKPAAEPVKTHFIGLPGAILVKVEDIVFQSKIRIEVASPIRADAFRAVNDHAPLISHKINLAFSGLTAETIRAPSGREELQALAKEITAQVFTDTQQTVEVTNVLFTEYLVR